MLKINDYLNRLARNEDEKRFIARISDLVTKAAQGVAGVSDFLDLRQQELAQVVAVNEPAIGWQLQGGYAEAERKRLVVYPEWQFDAEDGIVCLRICYKEFKDASLGHRDYLGAVLNLGIKREKLGDIVVQDTTAFLFADIGLADYICQQLQRVKHSSVAVEKMNREGLVFQSPELKTMRASLASLRLDAVIAAAYNLSRSEVNGLIESGQVKLNQLEVYKCSAPIKIGDLISVRGKGRFRLEEVGGISRKGRCQVKLSHW